MTLLAELEAEQERGWREEVGCGLGRLVDIKWGCPEAED